MKKKKKKGQPNFLKARGWPWKVKEEKVPLGLQRVNVTEGAARESHQNYPEGVSWEKRKETTNGGGRHAHPNRTKKPNRVIAKKEQDLRDTRAQRKSCPGLEKGKQGGRLGGGKLQVERRNLSSKEEKRKKKNQSRGET